MAFTTRNQCQAIPLRAALLCLVFIPPASAVAEHETSIELGRRIYHDGVLSNGALLEATVQGDVRLVGKGAACVNCHQRSGLGSTEGTYRVPPIAGAFLETPELALAVMPERRPHRPFVRYHPPYDQALLARAVREGIDAAGSPLAPLMPRYALNDADVASLADYLGQLSRVQSPGVSATEIHFATIVSEDVAPATRRAMLDVLNAYFNDKNAGTRNERQRARRGPWYKSRHYGAYRSWVLHLWELKGDPRSWPTQLEAFYERDPVFAILSGITNSVWLPIHRFCEERSVPCLFPHTVNPGFEPPPFYSFYFSRGVTLEAQALAQYLTETSTHVVQVFQNEPDSRHAAEAFEKAFLGRKIGQLDSYAVAAPPSPRFWRALAAAHPDAALVAWLDGDGATNIEWHQHSSSPCPLYLSASLLSDQPSLPTSSAVVACLTYPWVDPALAAIRSAGLRKWLQTKRIDPVDTTLQANTLFSAMITGDAVKHLRGYFHRDYLIEKIEHMTDTALPIHHYPLLTLGRNQRFGSKGVRIFQRNTDSDELVPVTERIVPWENR